MVCLVFLLDEWTFGFLVFFRIGSPGGKAFRYLPLDDDVKVGAPTPRCNRINALFSIYGIYLPKGRFTKQGRVVLRACP